MSVCLLDCVIVRAVATLGAGRMGMVLWWEGGKMECNVEGEGSAGLGWGVFNYLTPEGLSCVFVGVLAIVGGQIEEVGSLPTCLRADGTILGY